MKTIYRRAIGELAILIFMGTSLYSADIAHVQLLIASPDPVQAGTDVTFQIILVNAGKEAWDQKSYFIEVELYNLQKQYLLKSERMMGEQRVIPGGKTLIFVPLSVPEYYSGIYYYRMLISRGTERIYTGSYAPIRVNPLPIFPPKPPPIKIGGNTILSYKSDSSNDWKDYTGNVSVNLVGRVFDRSVLFNLYTIHDQDDAIDVYTILFNYYGSWVNIAIGDILPEFSELSVYGSSMRGCSWENQTSLFKTTVLGARLSESTEGSTETDGVYRRMMYAINEEISLPGKFTVAFNGLTGQDIESSVEVPGPTLKPEKNVVYGSMITWNGVSFLTIKGQYQASSWIENTLSTTTALTDSAYRGDVEIETDMWTISSYVQRTGPDFTSFGAPEATADRLTFDANTELYLFNCCALSGGYNKYYDDLDNDPDVIRTTQQIANGGVSLNFKTGTGLSGNYSNNTVIGEMREMQDNYTNTMSYGISQSLWGQSVAVTRQDSEFRDKVNPDSDLDTVTNSVNLNCAIGERFSGSMGASLSTNDNIMLLTEETNNSFSISVNQVIIKNKLTLQLWGSETMIESSDQSEDSTEVNGTMEFTYAWQPNVSVTLGGSRKTYSDMIDTADNYHETGAHIRVNYNF